ncbi:SatD family protein [Flavobacterium sp. TAB 87]|uniref:SatD family protein n=1 Tax=Flavobacterium sp. TAB 87 TaxID=1729581 RepID=UPI00076D728C|nr:SatD family protein [Flavobacterium sp. TAB 87]KVV14150.1 hypothetical protein AP058_02036 [Flavobacterium sp. TAB 87]
MTSVLTGDIINSRNSESAIWTKDLKQLLNQFGQSPENWELYRGDEFQLEIQNPEDAFITAILIKAHLKTIKLDARIGIGLGAKTYPAKKITESNGSAFIHSGAIFETLKKEKTTLALKSDALDFDVNLNLKIRLALTFVDSWLVQAAEFIVLAIQNPTLSQEEIGQKLGINQAAVSRRRKRANYDLILELDSYFRNQLKQLSR